MFLCVASLAGLQVTAGIRVNFHPFSGDLFDQWIVETIDAPFICPDGDPGTLTLVRPEAELEIAGTALVFHPTSFDWIRRNGCPKYRDPCR